MRFRIGWYPGGLVLALGAMLALSQSIGGQGLSPSTIPPSAGSRPQAPPARFLCGDMVAATAQSQGESQPRLPQSYQTEHFVIHYTAGPTSAHSPALDDLDQDGIPDYIELLGRSFEQAWTFYTTPSPQGMGYPLPPMTPGSRYPVVVYALAGGYSGLTWPDSKSGRRATSHISIDAHLYDPYVRQVAAHEFFHAIQFGYNYTASLWWREASADWAAHQVFPDVDTYIIPYYDWFQVPGWSLDYTDRWHEYGDSIWAEQLSETHGRDIIRSIWLNQRGENDSLKVIAQTLGSSGTTLAAQFRDFAAWNWFTGDRADGAHYKDGRLYPMIAPADHPADSMASFADAVQPLGSVYLALVPPHGAATAAPTPGGGAAGSAPVRTGEVIASPLARGLTLRLTAADGLDAQLILERLDGGRITVPFTGGRYHAAGFEQSLRRVVAVLSNGDTQVKHAFSGSIGLGVVYRDQYGYVWDLELSPAGAVRGTVDVGDKQPWPVHGQINGSSFHWRAVNPNVQTSWTTGLDVTAPVPDGPGASIRWTNDSGRSDAWIGALVDGSAPTSRLVNRRGPAQP